MVATLAIFKATEAAAKRCCGGAGCGTHGFAPGGGTARFCDGDGCMAWRWYETNVRNSEQPTPSASVAPDDLVPNGEIYGFCGLAGSPSPPRDLR